MTRKFLPPLGLGTALAFTFFCASQASAAHAVILEAGPGFSGNAPFQSGDGGEFTAILDQPIPSGYVFNGNIGTELNIPGNAYYPAGLGFETFCVEENVYFWVPTPTSYDYTITPYLQVPNESYANLYPGSNNTPLSQGAGWVNAPLAVGTSYLYSLFATGQLAGYDYADNQQNNSRMYDASQLQDTIWLLQGEGVDASNPALNTASGFGKTLNDDLVSQFGSFANAQAAATPGQFGVQVLDLYTTNSDGLTTGVYQDQLIYTGSVPDAADTALLFTAAAAALGLLRRRKGSCVDC